MKEERNAGFEPAWTNLEGWCVASTLIPRGGPEEIRTLNQWNANPSLCQLELQAHRRIKSPLDLITV